MQGDRPPFDSDLEYLGFWLRVLASLVDNVLLLLVIVPIGAWIYGPGYLNASGSGFQGFADIVVSFVLPAIAIVAFWIARQATPGKMLLRARIVDADTGSAPGYGQWAMRYVGYLVSTVPLGLGLVWVAFDPRKQGWHDKLARTVVVRPRPSSRVDRVDVGH